MILTYATLVRITLHITALYLTYIPTHNFTITCQGQIGSWSKAMHANASKSRAVQCRRVQRRAVQYAALRDYQTKTGRRPSMTMQQHLSILSVVECTLQILNSPQQTPPCDKTLFLLAPLSSLSSRLSHCHLTHFFLLQEVRTSSNVYKEKVQYLMKLAVQFGAASLQV